MRACALTDIGRLEVIEVPERPPAEDEVVLEDGSRFVNPKRAQRGSAQSQRVQNGQVDDDM